MWSSVPISFSTTGCIRSTLSRICWWLLSMGLMRWNLCSFLPNTQFVHSRRPYVSQKMDTTLLCSRQRMGVLERMSMV